jgi:hypothetical protein
VYWLEELSKGLRRYVICKEVIIITLKKENVGRDLFENRKGKTEISVCF